MLQQILQSRYLVETALREDSLPRAYRLRDLLGGDEGLLFFYPFAGRPPLDPGAFRLRDRRYRRLLTRPAPDCQIHESDTGLQVILGRMPKAAPLDGNLQGRALSSFLERLLGTLVDCHRAGFTISALEPAWVWRDEEDHPLLLPPCYLQTPGMTDLGRGEDSAQQAAVSAPSSPAWLPQFEDLLKPLIAGEANWSEYRELVAAPDASPQREKQGTLARLKRSPLAEALPAVAAALGEESDTLPEAVQGQLASALEAYRQGESVLCGLRAQGGKGGLALAFASIGSWLAEAGAGNLRPLGENWLAADATRARAQDSVWLLLADYESPELLAHPLWKRLDRGEPVERLFILYDVDALRGRPHLEAQIEALFQEIPRLKRQDVDWPAADGAVATRELPRLAGEDQPLLEIFALQDEPLSLGRLGRLFPVGEEELFARLERLESLELIAWDEGADAADGSWGLRVGLRDPGLRRRLRERMDPKRRRELHRLCVNLLGSESNRSLVRAYLKLRHLMGAELRPKAARDGIALFEAARRQGQPLLLAAVAQLLQEPMLAAELPASGQEALYLYLAERSLREGDLEMTEAVLRRGLRSLSGNPRFLDQLLEEPARTPQLRGAASAALLGAISALIRRLAELCETRGEFSQAVAYLERLLMAFSGSFAAKERGALYNDLAWMHYRMGRHPETVERCEIALRLFDPQRDVSELGQTYNTLGAAKWAMNQWAEAETYYKRAISLRERAGDENRIAASLNNLGNLYRMTERYSLAIDYFNRSLAIKKRLKNDPGYLISLYNVALINLEMNDHRTAHAQCLECLELNQRVGNVQIEAEVKGLLGEIAHIEGRSAEARQYLEEAIQTCREIGASTELATMLRRLGPVHLAEGDLTATRRVIEEGLRETWKVGSRFEEAQIRVVEGKYQLRCGDAEAAVEALEKAADILSSLDKVEWLARVYSRLGLVQLERGLELRARNCLQQATEIIERRQVSALIAEWEELRMRLQQRLDHFVKRIADDGKIHLGAFYQILNLLSGPGELDDVLLQIHSILSGDFGYRRLAYCFLEELEGLRGEAPFLLVQETLEDDEDWIGTSVALREDPRFLEQARDAAGQGATRLFVPIYKRGWCPGFLVVEREAGGCEDQERDFLNGIARLIAAHLAARQEVLPVARVALSPAPAGDGREEPQLIGKGRDMQRLRGLIRQVRDAEATVLITGESGTGKEEVARAIHFGGTRRDAPFRPVNCASIPEALLESSLFGHERGAFTGAYHRHIGVFEEAEGGNVFLDEIGEMGPDMQAKLLRVLQDKQFTRVGGTQSQRCDVRILAATNRDLTDDVAKGRFREDLFYRINVLHLHLAPLRAKREDIPLLTEFFLARLGREQALQAKRLAPEVMELFLRHRWPGNVRQLQNVLHASVLLSRGKVVQREDLPEDFLDASLDQVDRRSLDDLARMLVNSGSYSEGEPLEEMLLATLARRMVDEIGSKARAARLLGISKPTLYRRLKAFEALQEKDEKR